MSQVLTRARLAVHGVTSRPQCLVRNAARQQALRTPTLQKHRTYSAAGPVAPSTPPPGPTSTLLSQLPDAPKLAEHLSRVFAPLQFPPELAARILTHQSHRHAVLTNNARLCFIGRRVLKTYLLLFLNSSPALKASHDFEYIQDRALNTYVLGEYVAPQWQLGKVLKWTPATTNGGILDPTTIGRDASRSVGLYKVQGTAVEAAVGGVFHQFGGSVAHRLFHTRLLPHILLPGKTEGLNDAFHNDAMRICAEMGGPHCDIRDINQSSQKSQL